MTWGSPERLAPGPACTCGALRISSLLCAVAGANLPPARRHLSRHEVLAGKPQRQEALDSPHVGELVSEHSLAQAEVRHAEANGVSPAPFLLERVGSAPTLGGVGRDAQAVRPGAGCAS